METLKINTFDENIYFSARHFGLPLESIEIDLTTSEIISLDNIDIIIFLFIIYNAFSYNQLLSTIFALCFDSRPVQYLLTAIIFLLKTSS